MAKLKPIVDFLNKELRIKSIKDSSRNGLQVKCKSEINKIGFAVDASLSTFEKAKRENVDLLIVHHGIKWKPQKYPEITAKRMNFLKKNKISFYACHLPLDAHAKYGNNIMLCKVLDLLNVKKFGKYHGTAIGFSGEFNRELNIYEVAEILNIRLNTNCKIFNFGKQKIKSIGIVSGGGADAIEDAVKEKKDCFLTGEIGLGAYNRAKDFGLSMIVAGHYATETLGVKALMPVLSKRFKINTVFIEDEGI